MSGKLVSMTPPKGGYWALQGLLVTLSSPYPKVIGSEGTHTLGWDYVEERSGTQIEFTLKRFTGDTNFMEKVHSVFIPLEPAFTMFRMAMDMAIEDENNRLSARTAFDDAGKVSGDIDALNDAMQDQNQFLGEVLGPWFEPGPETAQTISTLYMCISMEVNLGFDASPTGPAPGFPGK